MAPESGEGGVPPGSAQERAPAAATDGVAEGCPHRLQGEVEGREGEQHQHRRADQPADEGEPERLPERIAQGQREQPYDRGEGGGDERPEPPGDGIPDRLAGGRSRIAGTVARAH